MPFAARLAAVLLLLLAPAAQAAPDPATHAEDGRCLGTLQAGIDTLTYLPNAEEFADMLARYQQVHAAWLQALKDDPSIDAATLQSINDAAAAERKRWNDHLAEHMTDEQYVGEETELLAEADSCADAAPTAGH